MPYFNGFTGWVGNIYYKKTHCAFTGKPFIYPDIPGRACVNARTGQGSPSLEADPHPDRDRDTPSPAVEHLRPAPRFMQIY